MLPTVGTLSRENRCPVLRKQRIIVVGNNEPMKNRIKELRQARRLTQPQLAALAGTTKNQLVKLENGDRRLSDHWAQLLAPHLGVQPYELFMPDGTHETLRFVPLIQHITCGNWQEAILNSEGNVPAVAGGMNVFALRAQGSNMDKLVKPEGYVYVDPDDRELVDGKTYAVFNGAGETTVKEYQANPPRLIPCSNDPQYRETVIGSDRFTVIGRIVGIYSPM